MECLFSFIAIFLNANSLAFILGLFVGLSELFSRYPWSFTGIIRNLSGLGYLCLNGVISLFAYRVAVDWNLLANLSDKGEYWRAIITSLLAMAFLRSSFANLKIDNKDVSAGIVSFLDVFLKKAEKSLDQGFTVESWKQCVEVTKDINYSASRDYLVAVTGAAMSSLTEAERNSFRQDADKIDKMGGVEDHIKLRLLAMRIIGIAGVQLFMEFAASAHTTLKNENSRAIEEEGIKLQRLKDVKKVLREGGN